MARTAKSTQLQIRVAPAEKAAIQRAARRAGMDMSAWVLARVLPAAGQRYEALLEKLREPAGARFTLAALNDLLSKLSGPELQEAVAMAPPAALPAFLRNYVAAMVEYACALQGATAPAWTRDVPPLPEPVFGSELPGLRLHLLSHSPAPFRRRNIFIDTSLGGRV